MPVLFTGATGFLGCRIVRELLSEGGDEPITVIGRHSGPELRARMTAALTWLQGPPLPVGALDRLHYLSGDITLPGLGLTTEERARATDGLHQLWHNAAQIRLEGDPAPLHLSNVVGTRHVLELADHAPDAHLMHVSTAYVAGRRLTGHVLEEDLREEHGFQTYYEESKYTAERLVRAWASRTGRPVTVFRPGLLVTDRPVPDGLPDQPLGTLLRLVDAGMRNRAVRNASLIAYVKGGWHGGEAVRVRVAADAEGTANLVQVEYAARAMARVAKAHTGRRAAVRTVHVTHPHNASVDIVPKAMKIRYPRLALSVVPHIPDPTPLETLIAQQGARMIEFSAHRRTYDRTGLLEAVGDLPDPEPIDETYLTRACGDPDAPASV
ncbi:SDR family oxidoreductase [Streptomyces sp. GS7]|uniref:SDR family oxidoreductase n=1 Tax=Streptomyces sp. GS7 TaxID=2692234 RepID=UPI001315F0D2|nr:SDR family oxidoreductase [Streptomyces sp. GS7]QHC23565.1 NAD-dependent epimerase/dehydratase family protein [Streptomyces sp. GS7]